VVYHDPMSLRAFVERKALARVFARVIRKRENFLPFDLVCAQLLSDIYLTDYDFNGADRAMFEKTIHSMPGRSANGTYWSDCYESLLWLEAKLRYKEVIQGRVRPRRHSALAKLVKHMALQLTPAHERLAELHSNVLGDNKLEVLFGYSEPSKLQTLLNRYFFESTDFALHAYLEELRKVSKSLYPRLKNELESSIDEFEAYLLMRDLLEEEGQR